MVFDERDRVVDFGVPRELLKEIIEGGEPFMTSGCPGKTVEYVCNRPYANCTPIRR